MPRDNPNAYKVKGDPSSGLRTPTSPKKKIAPSPPISPPRTLTDLQKKLEARRKKVKQDEQATPR